MFVDNYVAIATVTFLVVGYYVLKSRAEAERSRLIEECRRLKDSLAEKSDARRSLANELEEAKALLLKTNTELEIKEIGRRAAEEARKKAEAALNEAEKASKQAAQARIVADTALAKATAELKAARDSGEKNLAALKDAESKLAAARAAEAAARATEEAARAAEESTRAAEESARVAKSSAGASQAAARDAEMKAKSRLIIASMQEEEVLEAVSVKSTLIARAETTIGKRREAIDRSDDVGYAFSTPITVGCTVRLSTSSKSDPAFSLKRLSDGLTGEVCSIDESGDYRVLCTHNHATLASYYKLEQLVLVAAAKNGDARLGKRVEIGPRHYSGVIVAITLSGHLLICKSSRLLFLRHCSIINTLPRPPTVCEGKYNLYDGDLRPIEPVNAPPVMPAPTASPEPELLLDARGAVALTYNTRVKPSATADTNKWLGAPSDGLIGVIEIADARGRGIGQGNYMVVSSLDSNAPGAFARSDWYFAHELVVETPAPARLIHPSPPPPKRWNGGGSTVVTM